MKSDTQISRLKKPPKHQTIALQATKLAQRHMAAATSVLSNPLNSFLKHITPFKED